MELELVLLWSITTIQPLQLAYFTAPQRTQQQSQKVVIASATGRYTQEVLGQSAGHREAASPAIQLHLPLDLAVVRDRAVSLAQSSYLLFIRSIQPAPQDGEGVSTCAKYN